MSTIYSSAHTTGSGGSRMKRLTTIISSFSLFGAFIWIGGCASSGGASALTEAIPEGAVEIRLYSDLDPESFLNACRQRLEREGFNIGNYSSVDGTLRTNFQDIGRRVSLAVMISVEIDPVVSKTVAVLEGLQGVETEVMGPAVWSSSGGDPAWAFRALAETASHIEHENLVYRVR